MFERAYAKIYSNQGALTKGVDEETADGMSHEKISIIIELLRHEQYWWKPTRRIYIPKANRKRRALGLPTWSDKLVQEVIRSLLEAYYEPQFSNHSHAFRPNRGCHTVLQTVHQLWKGSKWWIEGDIEGFFDNIDHKRLMCILGKSIKDIRLLNLIRRYLNSGYMEDGIVHPTLSGAPQGGILSPLLSNIYLNELDEFVETVLIPANTSGKLRRQNPEYQRLSKRIKYHKDKENIEMLKELTVQRRQIPSLDPFDPKYRRLRYIRYADDFLMGFAGTKREAVIIKDALTQFLADNLRLDLNQEKTLITHAGSQPARFLGYDIQAQHANDQIANGRRSINQQIGLRVPPTVIDKHVRNYTRHGKPIHIAMLTLESDFAIVQWYQVRLRGIVQYYKLAWNVSHFWRLVSYMQVSLLKTLARKHDSTVGKMWKRHKAFIYNEDGKKVRCIEVRETSEDGSEPQVARFGGISLKRDKKAVPKDISLRLYTNQRSELLDRMRAEVCELCGVKGKIEIHHIHALKDLENVKGGRTKTPWQKKMAAMRRKTLAVCRPCHQDITYGRY